VNTLSSDVFILAFCAHVLELDDGHRHGMIHLGASVVSAVLEVAKKEGLKSGDVLRGIVMGYEVAVRCARAIQPGHKVRGYHVSGTCGTIGSALGVAFACNYNYDQLKSTLACAVSSAAGVLEIQEQASELKPYNTARAAYDGILAAQIGRLALPGPDDILGGKRGFLAALTDTPHPEFLTDFSEDDYCIEGIYQKVHAACRHCHPAIDATLDMRKNLHLQPDQIDKIEVHTYKLAVGSHDHIEIKGISSAKLSTPYAVALAIVKGSCGYADYNEDNLNDCWIKNLTQKVRVVEDGNLTAQSPAVRGARVTIYMKDGNEYNATCLYPKGEPENPLTQEELEYKFRGLASYGGLTSTECDEVISEIRKDSFDLNKILQICKL
jgi:2-methylcitrate dehydratase PrpD